MYKHIRWLIPAFCIFAFVIQPSYAVELIISDSGRNTAWSRSLNIGDDFSVIGADDKPVGGIIPHTTAIHQALVPMPQEKELEQMSQKQENIWVENLGELLKDRVHIATTNGATIFEIRLLQDTPQPSAATMSWQENPRTGRFAHMSYQAIGKLVTHLQDRKEPVRITAALADSGCTAFAQAIEYWKPYSETLRRVDLVDGRTSLAQIRPVISVLGCKRVRLFHTTGIPMTPAMTIGRREVAENLLKSCPHLTLYSLTSNEAESVQSDQSAQSPWMDSLSGSRLFNVKRRQYVDGKAIEQVLVGGLTGQDFRDPIAGLDPENSDYQTGESMMKMGIIAPVSDQPVIPTSPTISTSGAIVGKTSQPKAGEGTLYYFRIWGEGDFERADDIRSQISKAIGKDIPIVYTVGEAYKETSSGRPVAFIRKNEYSEDFNGLHVSSDLSSFTKQGIRKIEANSVGGRAASDLGIGITFFELAENTINTSNSNTELTITTFDTTRGIHHRDVKNDIYKMYGGLNNLNNRIKTTHVLPSGGVLDNYDINKAKETGATVIERRRNEIEIGVSKRGLSSSFKIKDQLSSAADGVEQQSKYLSPESAVRARSVEGTYADVYRHQKSRQQLIGRNNQTPYSTMKIPDTSSPSDIRNAFSRVNRDTKLVFRSPIILDRHTMNDLDQRNISRKLDPLGNKDIKQGTIIVSSSAFEQPKIQSYKRLSINHLEDKGDLGEFTRNNPPSSIMQDGFQKSQKFKVGDLADFDKIRSSSFDSSKYSMRVGKAGFDNFQMRSLNNKLLPTQDIGGVMLNKSAKVEGGGNTLNTGNVSLVFQNSAGVIDFMKLQRFSTALWATYLSVEGPGISIDPVSESFKEFGDKHRVRYIGQVYNTEIGKVMRETDHLMKRWAIGTHRPDIGNFLSPDEINEKSKNKTGLNRASRFWFVPDGFTFKRSDDMLLFSGGRMTLQTEYLDNNSKGEKNQANERFAQWFTENYNLVAERYPIFGELFEYAQLVSLSTYLRENRVPMLWFLMANREIILTEDSIDKVDQLVKKSGYKWYVKIYGGVELQLGEALRNEKSYENDPALQVAEDVLRDNTSDKDGSNAPVVFSANDTSYTVTSKNTLKLFKSSAEGDTIQTDLALVDQYHEDERGGATADKKEWNLIAPHLELIRYYSPELRTRAQFGDGWHLLVPFRLETEKQTSLPGAGFIPKRVVMTNLLSGMREVLELEGREGLKLQYAPAESGGLTKNLTRFADGSWRLQDILGAKFVFDQEGDLRQMTLREDHTVKFKLGSKKYSKRVPGYNVKYNYNTSKVKGQDLKVLTSIKQGGHTARIDWLPNNTVMQIAGIRVLQQGKARPVEVLSYEYGQDGMLARVTSQSGRYVSFRYEDDHMRVAALQK